MNRVGVEPASPLQSRRRERRATWMGLALTWGLLLSGGGCALGPDVASTPPAPDLRTEHTFAFLPQPKVRPSRDRSLDERLRAVVTRELQHKGYRSVDPGQADFVVSFYTNLAGPLDSSTLGYSSEKWERQHAPDTPPSPVEAPDTTNDLGRWQTGYYRDPRQYVNIQVVIDAVDPQRHELLWRGWARTKSPPEELSLGELADAAVRVLERFPSR